jgi:hypothetical protein
MVVFKLEENDNVHDWAVLALNPGENRDGSVSYKYSG